jgi:hypothetical protein
MVFRLLCDFVSVRENKNLSRHGSEEAFATPIQFTEIQRLSVTISGQKIR